MLAALSLDPKAAQGRLPLVAGWSNTFMFKMFFEMSMLGF